jgi:hypothetical protein
MNYKRIHDQIIQLAQLANRKKGNQIYYERHHIIPKCMGGNDDIENLVLLTGREHFIIHKLLCEIYPDNLKLKHAIWAMCNQKTTKQERYIPSSRVYSEAKAEYLQMHSNNLKAFFRTEEGLISKCNASIKKGNTLKNFYQTKEGAISRNKQDLNRRKPIKQFLKDGTLIKEWNSGKEAGELLGIHPANITACLKKRYKSAGGFIWKYKEKELEN